MRDVARALDLSDDAVLVLERLAACDARILGANAGFARMTGFAAEQVPGMALAEWLVEPWPVGAAIRNQISLPAESACRRQDGTIFWLGLTLLPGEAGRVVLIGRDIRERRRAAEQDHAVQQLLTRVFVGVDAAVAIASADGRILMTNPAFDRLVGSAPGALIGYPTISLVAEESRETVRRVVECHILTGDAYAIDLKAIRLDGRRIDVHLRCAEADRHDMHRHRILTVREIAAPHAGPPRLAAFQVAGKVRLIGLAEVKAELGALWSKVAARALDTAETVIRRRLGPLETFSRTTDEGFLICFADRTEEEATFAAAMIARDIKQRLIGQGENPRASDVHAIVAALAIQGPPFESQLNAQRLAIEAAARRSLAALATVAEGRLTPIFGTDETVIVGHYGGLTPRTRDTLFTAIASLPVAERAEFELHGMTLALIAQQVRQDMPAGLPGMLMVDVGFSIFEQRVTTDAYLEICRKLDPATRDRLILVLHLPPDPIIGSRLIDCVQILRRHCRGVSFATDAIGSVPVDLTRTPAAVLVLDADRLTGDRWEEKLVQFLATLHARRGRLMVHRVTHPGIAAKLRGLGVDLLSVAA